MTRPIVVSNGSMHVGVNLYGLVHDFYFPYVGLENHAAQRKMRHRIGIWVGGQFSWLDDGHWELKPDYLPGALVSNLTTHNEKLGVSLHFNSFVDAEFDVFMRRITVTNHKDKKREIRIFLAQVFLIGMTINGDTAQYLPNDHAILHYKGHRNFIIGARTANGKPFDQYNIGIFGSEGQEAFRDAEDGELVASPVEFNSADSVVGFSLELDAGASAELHYWITASKTLRDAEQVYRKFSVWGLEARFNKTIEFWKSWLAPAEKTIKLLPDSTRDKFRKNLLIVKAHIDKRGAIMASTDTAVLNYSRDAYIYCWPRDAAYALLPLLRLGYKAEIKNFLAFCKDVLQPEGYLMHKYQADGALGSSWHPYVHAGKPELPIQEDETAIVIYLMGEYLKLYPDDNILKEFYGDLVAPAANWMTSYIDSNTKLPHASYDLWEEKFLTSTYSTALTYCALKTAAEMADKIGMHQDSIKWTVVAEDIKIAASKLLYNKTNKFFVKGFVTKMDGQLDYDYTIDISSFYGAYFFGLFDVDSDEVRVAYQTLVKEFALTENGPQLMPRYKGDVYYIVNEGPGNPWVITSLWLAQYHALVGKKDIAQATQKRIEDLMLQSGVLPEQFNPVDNKFISAAPLTWSQAEYLTTVLDLYKQ